MTNIHIGCASLNQTPLAWDINYDNIASAINEAKSRGIDILCFPELCISGYNCEDMFHADWIIQKSYEYLIKISKLTKDITIIIGHPFKYSNNLYNCASIIKNELIKGIVPKQILASEEIYYEPRWFTPWLDDSKEISFNNQIIPFGKLAFKQQNIIFALEICEDAWSENRPGYKLINDGVHIIFNPSASHFTLGKLDRRIKLAEDLVNKNQSLIYAYSNLLGNEAGRAIYDGSSFIASKNSICLAPRFSFKNYEIVSKIISYKKDSFTNNFSHSHYFLIDIGNNKNINIKSEPTNDRKKCFEDLKQEDKLFHEFTYAVSLGLYDYLRKSGNKRFAISLSGGADSAACLVLSHLAYQFALKQRGLKSVENDLCIKSGTGLEHDLIYCLYLKTKNNSKKTEDIAYILANKLNAFIQTIDINDIVKLYTKKTEDVLNKSLNWQDDNIALQNIQARSRGPLIWFLANIKNALLIATSNRSEAAVGYTTMDGDTCGGISPIGGIDKAFLLSWLKWLSEHNNTEYGDFSFLKEVTSLQPAAELKPPEYTQKDETELMPYAVLSIIEEKFIRDKLPPNLIVEESFRHYPEFTKEQHLLWVNKFLSLWRSNQWKRERYAPSFHIDDESLDPKTWCRYPILSGKLI